MTDFTGAELAALQNSRLFSGLSGEALSSALAFFGASLAAYPRGGFAARAGEPLPFFGLVLSGTVEVSMLELSGEQTILASVGPGETFGEALCFLEIPEIPVYIRAAEDARLLRLRCEKVRECACSQEACLLKNRFIGMMADRTLRMNSRIQILSKKSLREKLTLFFTDCANQSGGCEFTVPFDRSGMAAYLGADRSALSRELSRLRSEGRIEYRKNSFKICNLQK
jgi:CRP-like cAMP-binding protein